MQRRLILFIFFWKNILSLGGWLMLCPLQSQTLYLDLTDYHPFICSLNRYISIECLLSVRYCPPQWLSGKESACQCRRCRFDLWVGKTPGEGNGNPLHYSCLRNPMDRGAWRATVQGVVKSRTWQWLHNDCTRSCRYTGEQEKQEFFFS